MTAGVEMVLVRQANELTPKELEVWQQLSLRLVGGANQVHHKRWRRFLSWVGRAGAGEFLTWFMRQARNGPYHRFHFLVEQRLYDAQDRFEDFEQFRTWLKIGAGFVDWYPGPKGGVVPVPRSMSYAELDENGMRELHAAMMLFVRTEHAGKTLWKHLMPSARLEMIEGVLKEFDE